MAMFIVKLTTPSGETTDLPVTASDQYRAIHKARGFAELMKKDIKSLEIMSSKTRERKKGEKKEPPKQETPKKK